MEKKDDAIVLTKQLLSRAEEKLNSAHILLENFTETILLIHKKYLRFFDE